MSSEPNLHGFCFKIFIFRRALRLTLEFCRSLILRLWNNFTSQHWPHHTVKHLLKISWGNSMNWVKTKSTVQGEAWKGCSNTWATKKTLITFHYPGWFIGILIMASYIPYIIGQYNPIVLSRGTKCSPQSGVWHFCMVKPPTCWKRKKTSWEDTERNHSNK